MGTYFTHMQVILAPNPWPHPPKITKNNRKRKNFVNSNHNGCFIHQHTTVFSILVLSVVFRLMFFCLGVFMSVGCEKSRFDALQLCSLCILSSFFMERAHLLKQSGTMWSYPSNVSAAGALLSSLLVCYLMATLFWQHFDRCDRSSVWFCCSCKWCDVWTSDGSCSGTAKI